MLILSFYSNIFRKILFEFKYFYSNSNILIQIQILLCFLGRFYLKLNIFMPFDNYFSN